MQHLFRFCAPPGVHLPNGRQPRPNLALALTLHLVRGRTERRDHLLMHTHTEMSLPTFLAEVAQLDGIRLRLSQTLQRRRLSRYSRQHGLKHVQLPALLLQARQHLPNRSRTYEQAAQKSSAGFPPQSF